MCFLLKTAVAIPFKKSIKQKTNVFLRGSRCAGAFSVQKGILPMGTFL